jgi:hypothetical protein
MPTINIDDRMDRWRYRCPHGHASWEPTNNHFWCQACARSTIHDEDVDPSFTHLLDQRTGEELAREDVRLLTEAGAYEDIGRRV